MKNLYLKKLFKSLKVWAVRVKRGWVFDPSPTMLNLSIRFRLALAYVRSSSFQRAIILTLNNVSVRLAVFPSSQLNQTHAVNYLNPDKGILFSSAQKVYYFIMLEGILTLWERILRSAYLLYKKSHHSLKSVLWKSILRKSIDYPIIISTRIKLHSQQTNHFQRSLFSLFTVFL